MTSQRLQKETCCKPSKGHLTEPRDLPLPLAKLVLMSLLLEYLKSCGKNKMNISN
jgi:hypothetical protein